MVKGRAKLLFVALSGSKPVRVYPFAARLPWSPSALWSTTSDLVTQQEPTLSSFDVRVLSKDPLVYIIDNLLDESECQAYRDRVAALEAGGQRSMTRSNPPSVSLDATKLWPLPFLSLGAGVPPLIRLLETPSDFTADQVLAAVVPNIVGALLASLLLAFGVVLPLVRRQAAASSRTSVALALNLESDMDFVRPLVDRVSSRTHQPWSQWEAPVVTRYDPGAVFKRHNDASPTKGSEWADTGGQRIITCICYLNDVPAGGATYFDRQGFGVQPQAGSALVFFPADSISLEADDRTRHESLPAKGDKWIMQLFGRAIRVPPPLGLPDTYGDLP